MAGLIRWIWIAFFALALVGGRTRYACVAAGVITLIGWIVALRRGSGDNYVRQVASLEPRSTPGIVFSGLLGLTALCAVAANLLNFEAMEAFMYDTSLYIQSTRNLAFTGVAEQTLYGGHVDSAFYHFTPSLKFFGALYHLIPHPWVLILWQVVFLLAPGLVACHFLGKTYASHGLERDRLAELLLFLVFCCSPVIYGNLLWPYTWHIFGIFAYGLAYYFYVGRRPIATALSLVVFAIHKEEFALFASGFAIIWTLDEFVQNRKLTRSEALPAILSVAGVLLYAWASVGHGSFSDRFANLGQTPGQAVAHLVTDPGRWIVAWKTPESLAFFSFFVLSPFLFLRPRWSVLRLYLPIFPFLVLYCSSTFDLMREFRHHYALPIFIGSFGTFAYGVLPELIERWPAELARARVRFVLLLALALGAVWQQGTPFRAVREEGRTLAHRWKDRQWIEQVRAQNDEVLCCEERLCTLLSDRRFLIQAKQCVEGSQLLQEVKPSRVGFLIYADSPLLAEMRAKKMAISIPQEWDYSSSFMKFKWIQL